MYISQSPDRLLSQQMSDCTSKIVLLVINKGFSKSVDSLMTSFDKVFVDDYQLFVDNIHYNALNCRFADECNDIISMGLIPILINNDKSDTSVWVFFDEAQSFTDKYAHILPNRKMYIANMDSFKRYFVTSKLELSINLRNILEISTVLSIIRRHYQKLDFTKSSPGSATGSVTGSANWPHQVGGHFLRGTKPVIYLLGENEPASWNDILIGELEKLLGSGSHLTNKDIAVLLSVNPDNLKLATETFYSITGRWDTTDNLITVQFIGHSVSAEWPAVISIIRFKPITFTATLSDNSKRKITLTNVIPALYTTISRARVYSAVIVYNYTPNHCEYTDELICELKQRRDVCRIIER